MTTNDNISYKGVLNSLELEVDELVECNKELRHLLDEEETMNQLNQADIELLKEYTEEIIAEKDILLQEKQHVIDELSNETLALMRWSKSLLKNVVVGTFESHVQDEVIIKLEKDLLSRDVELVSATNIQEQLKSEVDLLTQTLKEKELTLSMQAKLIEQLCNDHSVRMSEKELEVSMQTKLIEQLCNDHSIHVREKELEISMQTKLIEQLCRDHETVVFEKDEELKSLKMRLGELCNKYLVDVYGAR